MLHKCRKQALLDLFVLRGVDSAPTARTDPYASGMQGEGLQQPTPGARGPRVIHGPNGEVHRRLSKRNLPTEQHLPRLLARSTLDVQPQISERLDELR
jgi:hypothetical protein